MKQIYTIILLAPVLFLYADVNEQDIHLDTQTQSVLSAKESYQINWTTALLGFGLCYAIHRIYKHESQIRDLSDSLEQYKRDLAVQKVTIEDHTKTLLGPNYKEFNGEIPQISSART